MVLAAATATILAALAFEFVGGYVPCPLCLQQRYAYYFAIPAAAAAWFAARLGANGAARILLAVIAVAFLLNAGLGGFHSGVEWKLWQGPDTCATASDLQWGADGVVDTPVVRCDEAPWTFLGLSFAGWNAVISLFLAGLAAFGATRRS